ncbi:Asp23/Gls24 family envelope stress response protein, partial [Amycolatopsis lexingtonensis]
AAGTRGSTTVADGVVAKIVTRVAAKAEGVHSVAEDGITIELADEVAWITIPLVIDFGHAVKALGEQIRVAVIDAVEQYLGLDVEVVDVHVTDIHFPEAD